MSNFIRAQSQPQTAALLKLGYCINSKGEDQLVADGIEPELIWMRGRGAEDLDYALRYFRGRPGTLAVADDLRVFGPTRKDICGTMARLHESKIVVEDVRTGNRNPHELEHLALIALSSSASMKNHRTARRRGSKGGNAKREAEAARRSAQIADDIALRLCASAKLTWLEKSEILGMTPSTIQRHYRS